jgi:hypothetical protein
MSSAVILILATCVLGLFLWLSNHFPGEISNWLSTVQQRFHIYWKDNPPALRDDELPPGIPPSKRSLHPTIVVRRSDG